MEKIINTLQGRKKTEPRLTRNSKLFKVVINAIRDKKGTAIVSLDLRKIEEGVADFFIVCEAQSHVQIKAIAENIKDEVWQQCDEKPYHIEHGQQWTLVDYVNIVVHIFDQEHRKFYDLESLWADVSPTDHED